MRKTATMLFIAGILGLALTPWLLMDLSPRPLLPEDLRLAPTRYQLTVAAAQNSTHEAMRQATSVPVVVVIGTVPTNKVVSIDGTSTVVSWSPTMTQPATTTATIQSVVIVVESTLPSVVSTPLPTTPEPSRMPIGVLSTPAGMINVEDTITEQQLVDQIQRDAGNGSLPNLTIHFTLERVNAYSLVSVFPGIQQQVEAWGTFVVENNSLVFRASSIQLDGVDVTDRYRGQLESEITTSLYRLLPERYVQSFELANGQIYVYSKKKP